MRLKRQKIFDLIFKDSSIKYGLQEFPRDVFKGISFFEKEDGKVYVKCLKRNKDIFVYDKNMKEINRINLPERPISMTFGGEEGNTLFVTTLTSLYGLKVK